MYTDNINEFISRGGEMAGTEYGIEGSDCHFFYRNTIWNNFIISGGLIRDMVNGKHVLYCDSIIPVLVHAV